MVKIKLTKEYLSKIKVTSDGIYEVEEARAKELVDAGNAEYLEGKPEVEEKEVETKVMKPRKKRTYKTK